MSDPKYFAGSSSGFLARKIMPLVKMLKSPLLFTSLSIGDCSPVPLSKLIGPSKKASNVIHCQILLTALSADIDTIWYCSLWSDACPITLQEAMRAL